MSDHPDTIHIHQLAPVKPVPGAPCNGCGVCCLLEPCPLGMVLTGRRSGACRVLHWQAQLQRYQCGAMVMPGVVLQQRLPARLVWMAPALRWMLGRWAGRWVAAGVGCDCDVDIVSPVRPA